MSPTHPPRELRCVGQTVWDCFKGDYVCVEVRSCDRDDYLDERAQVIARLDSAAVEIKNAFGLGGDLRWVEGQRVALRLADRKFDEAAEVAKACTASDWWCAALRGYIAHLRHDYETAEREYRASVSVMPGEVRCRWTSLHANYAFDGNYEKIEGDCKELPLTHPIWTLWDPLFPIPGNDRLTEHFARHTAVRLRNDALDAIAPGRMSHLDAELIQRGLWDSWTYVTYEQNRQQGRSNVRYNSTTMYAIRPRWERSGLRFLPSLEMAQSPFSTTSSDWRVSEDNGADQYRPAYGTVRSFLVREDPGPAPSPEEVAALMLPVWEWRRSDGPLHLYWEYYLPQDITTAQLRLDVLQQSGGVWNRVTSVFGSTPQTRSLSWTDELAPTRGAFLSRSIAIDTASLPSGEYRLALSVTAGDLPPVTVERSFRLR